MGSYPRCYADSGGDGWFSDYDSLQGYMGKVRTEYPLGRGIGDATLNFLYYTFSLFDFQSQDRHDKNLVVS